MKGQDSPESDDDSIVGEETLYRLCKTGSQLSKREDGTYIFSDKIFAPNGKGCSVEIKSLLADAGETAQSRFDAHNAFAVVSVTVHQVRTLRFGSQEGGRVGLKVAYTPLGPEKPGGPNQFHADIFPGPSPSASKALTRQKAEVIPIDQQRAAAEYAKKFVGK